MKVGFVALADFDESSSTVRRVHMLGKGLAVLGHEVHIIVPQRFRPGPMDQELDGLHIHWGTLTTKATWTTPAARVAARVAAVRLANQLAAKGCEWFVLYNLGLEGLPMIIAARRHGARVAAEYCDLRVQSHRPNLEEQGRALWHKAADTLIPRLTQLNIAISRYLEKWLRLSAPRTPVLLIPPLVDADLFHIQPAEAKAFRDKWDLHNTSVISYLGSYWTVEGVGILVDAAKQLAASGERFKLVISGKPLPGRDCDPVPQLIEEGHLDSMIVQTGWLPTEEIVAAMSAADILAVPKIDHVANLAGVPTKLAEYMAMSCAVVATRVGDIPLYLSHGENAILCEPSNSQDLAAALQMLLQDPDLRRHLGQNARQTALQYFDYHAAGQSLATTMFSK